VETKESNRFVIITHKHLEACWEKENDFIAYMESNNKRHAIVEAKFDGLQEKILNF